MTIGDEKVVAWRNWIGGAGGKWSLYDFDPRTVHDNGQEVQPLIPQSAYAELAAERDLYLEQAASNETGRMAEWHRAELFAEQLQAAESQLAELRGKCEGLADEMLMPGSCENAYEDGFHSACSVYGAKLRELAAADGG